MKSFFLIVLKAFTIYENLINLIFYEVCEILYSKMLCHLIRCFPSALEKNIFFLSNSVEGKSFYDFSSNRTVLKFTNNWINPFNFVLSKMEKLFLCSHCKWNDSSACGMKALYPDFTWFSLSFFTLFLSLPSSQSMEKIYRLFIEASIK